MNLLSIPLFHYRPEYDDIESSPVWLNIAAVVFIMLSIWYNNSQRVEDNKELVNFDLKAKFFILSKLMFADIKESPFIFIICIGILILYWLLLTYDWFFYVLLAIALIVFIFCKIRRKR